MKKNIFFLMALAAAAITFSSCSDEESEGKSRITYYAILEMNGDEKVSTQKGEAFNDPGCVATMNGEDVSDQIVTTSNLNTNACGFYTVNYSVTNPDGFAATASRTVNVVDRNNFASTYWSEAQYGTRHYYNLPVTITDRGDGTYLINDLAGGFYCYGRYPGYDAYGYDFFLESVIQLNSDNTVTLVAQGSWYWGIPISITTGTYDPESGTISLLLDFDGDPMYVTLTK